MVCLSTRFGAEPGDERCSYHHVETRETQEKFSTGVQIDRDSFSLVEFDALVIAYCPYCKHDHTWRYRDVEYVEFDPA